MIKNKNNEGDVYKRGILLVLSSPSGAGKTTITRCLLKENPHTTLSVSVTTRPRRPGEVSGQDYIFATKDEFEKMVANDEFLEYAKVFGHYYGTLKKTVEEAIAAGKDVIFDIDWQGTQTLAQKAPADLVSVFILPPSLQVLEKRLRARNQDPDEVVESRMEKAASEMSHWAEYKYVIINKELDESVARVCAILKAERQKRERQEGLAEFVKKLVTGQ